MLLRDPKAAPEGYGKEYGAYYSRRITAIEFDKENGCKQTDFGSVHVLDSSGVSAFSSIELPFDPLSEEIHVNSVRVVDSGGGIPASGVAFRQRRLVLHRGRVDRQAGRCRERPCRRVWRHDRQATAALLRLPGQEPEVDPARRDTRPGRQDQHNHEVLGPADPGGR